MSQVGLPVTDVGEHVDLGFLRSAELAIWVNHWVAYGLPADDFIAGTKNWWVAERASGQIRQGLLDWLVGRGIAPTSSACARPVFPCPGDLAGTPGPKQLQREATAAGHIVAFDAYDVTLLPDPIVAERWQVSPSNAAPGTANIARPETAPTELNAATLSALQTLTKVSSPTAQQRQLRDGIDVVSQSIESLNFPETVTPQTRDTVCQAARMLAVWQLANVLFSHAALGHQQREPLTDLAATARRSLSAACQTR